MNALRGCVTSDHALNPSWRACNVTLPPCSRPCVRTRPPQPQQLFPGWKAPSPSPTTIRGMTSQPPTGWPPGAPGQPPFGLAPFLPRRNQLPLHPTHRASLRNTPPVHNRPCFTGLLPFLPICRFSLVCISTILCSFPWLETDPPVPCTLAPPSIAHVHFQVAQLLRSHAAFPDSEISLLA